MNETDTYGNGMNCKLCMFNVPDKKAKVRISFAGDSLTQGYGPSMAKEFEYQAYRPDGSSNWPDGNLGFPYILGQILN